MRCLLLTILLSITSVLFSQEDTLGVEWQQDYRLTWSDFKGKEDKSQKLSALSKIAIPYNYSSDGEVDLTINLATVFVKDESWYKVGKENDVLLAHEQLHFDIAEVHRRLIVKAILNGKFTSDNYANELREIITEIWDNDYRAMQDLYDKETNYARLFKSQIKWNKTVAKKLLELEQYKMNTITVVF